MGSNDFYLLSFFYRVRRAIDEVTKEEVAIKEIDKQRIKQVDLAEHLKKEISFNKQFFIFATRFFLSFTLLY